MTWDKKPSLFAAVVQEDNEDRMRAATFVLLRGVILDSPVDTGRYRANWQVEVGDSPDRDTVDADSYPDGQQVLGREMQKITPDSVKGAGSIYVYNNVEYAQYIEYGSDTMPPRAVLSTNLLRVRSRLRRGQI